ncbi:MAG: type II secretion system protein [Clostridiaceae bacterium]
MLNSKADKGFTIIEVIISLCIFAMIFSGALLIMKSTVKLKAWNEATKTNLDCLEGLKGIMENSMSYNDIIDLCRSGRIYIAEENLNLDTMKAEEIESIFTELKPEEGSYITIYASEGNVLTVEIDLYQKAGSMENEFITKFYKGSYRRH